MSAVAWGIIALAVALVCFAIAIALLDVLSDERRAFQRRHPHPPCLVEIEAVALILWDGSGPAPDPAPPGSVRLRVERLRASLGLPRETHTLVLYEDGTLTTDYPWTRVPDLPITPQQQALLAAFWRASSNP